MENEPKRAGAGLYLAQLEPNPDAVTNSTWTRYRGREFDGGRVNVYRTLPF